MNLKEDERGEVVVGVVVVGVMEDGGGGVGLHSTCEESDWRRKWI